MIEEKKFELLLLLVVMVWTGGCIAIIYSVVSTVDIVSFIVGLEVGAIVFLGLIVFVAMMLKLKKAETDTKILMKCPHCKETSDVEVKYILEATK